jgi:ribosomal protein L22
VSEKTNEIVDLKAVAHLRNVRISNRKVKIVADLIRNKNVEDALNILNYAPKAASILLYKLLKSAMANAENNHNMKTEKLYVAEIYANEGPTLKRIRPAAKGTANRINKRTSHITIVLKERN